MRHIISLLLFIFPVMLHAQESVRPKSPAPQMKFVMQLSVTIDGAYTVGDIPQGHRQIIPITGGTFSGPNIRGTIIPGGADYQLSADEGSRTQLEAIYSIRTDDGVNIHVRNCGIISNGKDENGKPTFYFRAAPRFEAPSDSRYAWLNNAIFVCAPSLGTPGTIILDVWKVE